MELENSILGEEPKAIYISQTHVLFHMQILSSNFIFIIYIETSKLEQVPPGKIALQKEVK